MSVSKIFLLGEIELDKVFNLLNEQTILLAGDLYRSEQVKRGTDFRVAIPTSNTNEIAAYLVDDNNNIYKICAMIRSTGKRKITNLVIMPEDCRLCSNTLTFIEGTGVCVNCNTLKDLVN